MRRQPRCASRGPGGRREILFGNRGAERRPEVAEHPRIAERPMPRAAGQAVPLHHRVQTVPRMLGKQAPRQFDRAQHGGREMNAGAPEFGPQEGIIEARIVSREHRRHACGAIGRRAEGRRGHGRRAQASAQFLENDSRNLGEARRALHHFVGDAGEALDVGGNQAFGIDQRAPFLDHGIAVDSDDADLGDAVIGRITSGRLQIDKNQIARKLAGLRRVHRATGAGSTDRGAGRGRCPTPGDSGECRPDRTSR